MKESLEFAAKPASESVEASLLKAVKDAMYVRLFQLCILYASLIGYHARRFAPCKDATTLSSEWEVLEIASVA